MGRKIPLWQCLVVILVMAVLLYWSIMVDQGGEPHIALIIAASIAGIIARLNGWKWAYMEKGILASINRSMQCHDCILDGCRYDSFHDVLWYQGYQPEHILTYFLYPVLHRIPGNRFLMVHSRFHGCCLNRCRYSPGLS